MGLVGFLCRIGQGLVGLVRSADNVRFPLGCRTQRRLVREHARMGWLRKKVEVFLLTVACHFLRHAQTSPHIPCCLERTYEAMLAFGRRVPSAHAGLMIRLAHAHA